MTQKGELLLTNPVIQAGSGPRRVVVAGLAGMVGVMAVVVATQLSHTEYYSQFLDAFRDEPFFASREDPFFSANEDPGIYYDDRIILTLPEPQPPIDPSCDDLMLLDWPVLYVGDELVASYSTFAACPP